MDKIIKYEPMYVAGYYRPEWTYTNHFFMHLESFLTKHNSMCCVILGDINVDVFNLNNYDYINLIRSFDFDVSNIYRTRPISKTLLDHFITNFGYTFSIFNHTIDNDFSDHSIILSEINMHTSNEQNGITRLSKFIDYAKFKSSFDTFLNEESYVHDDVNSLSEFLIKGINSSELISTSYNVVRKRKKEQLCPWITKEIITLCNYKSNLLKKIKNNATRSVNSELLKHRLNVISNVIIYKKRIEKQNYYCRLFQNSSPFKTWQNIKKVLVRK